MEFGRTPLKIRSFLFLVIHLKEFGPRHVNVGLLDGDRKVVRLPLDHYTVGDQRLLK